MRPGLRGRRWALLVRPSCAWGGASAYWALSKLVTLKAVPTRSPTRWLVGPGSANLPGMAKSPPKPFGSGASKQPAIGSAVPWLNRSTRIWG
jgi:hypothetical protein